MHPAQGVFVLVQRRTPAWLYLLILPTLPLGLLLLLVKQSEVLAVVLVDVEAGLEVRVHGRTRQSVVKTLARTLGSSRTTVNVR